MNFSKRHTRHKGQIETFVEDATRYADEIGLDVLDMVATITAGNSAGINEQAYDSVTQALSFQIAFTSLGTSILRIETTFVGSDEKAISLYKLRTIDDGTAYVNVGYM